MSTPPVKVPEGELVIPLTGRRPVRLRTADWPVIACVKEDSWTGTDPARYVQASMDGQLDEYEIIVRQHADGRAVVSGTFTPRQPVLQAPPRDDFLNEAGELVPAGSSAAAAITRVGRTLGVPGQFIQDAIGALPPEDLTAAE
jgi:hypothetical protein